MNERDFVGYGVNPPRVEWPDGARIAISVVVNYEEGSEYSLLDGDAHRETNSEVPSPLTLDQRDLANESFFEYGSRAGVWRLMDILSQYQVNATFFCCALALERNPQVGPEIVRRGHEVFGHGYRWEEYYKMDRDAEREGHRQGSRVDTASDGPAASGVVHPLRPQRQHPRARRRGGRVPLRLELLRGRPPLLHRRWWEEVAGRPLLAGGKRHQILARGHGQSRRFL